jgi:hypothetical protein
MTTVICVYFTPNYPCWWRSKDAQIIRKHRYSNIFYGFFLVFKCGQETVVMVQYRNMETLIMSGLFNSLKNHKTCRQSTLNITRVSFFCTTLVQNIFLSGKHLAYYAQDAHRNMHRSSGKVTVKFVHFKWKFVGPTDFVKFSNISWKWQIVFSVYV